LHLVLTAWFHLLLPINLIIKHGIEIMLEPIKTSKKEEVFQFMALLRFARAASTVVIAKGETK